MYTKDVSVVAGQIIPTNLFVFFMVYLHCLVLCPFCGTLFKSFSYDSTLRSGSRILIKWGGGGQRIGGIPTILQFS